MRYAENNGVRIRYELAGNGPPLVLQHGLSDSLETWYETGCVEALAARHQLILIDARGHGASDKPHDPAAYRLEHRVGDVLAVLDVLGHKQAAYLGYSMGGWIGFGLAAAAPQRLRPLVLGGSQPYGQSMQWFRDNLRSGMPGWLAVLKKLAAPYVTPRFEERMLRNDVTALMASVADDRPDLSATLPGSNVPCLLFAGEADPLCKPIRRLADDWAGSQLLTVPRRNHMEMAFEVRQIVSPVQEFLEEFLAAGDGVGPAQ